MGCLLSGPREEDLEPDEWQEHQRDQAVCWRQWRAVVTCLLVTVMVEEEVRAALEARYLGGQTALLAATQEDWERFAEQVDRLWSIAETTSEAGGTANDDVGDGDLLGGRVDDRVRHLADDARIATFERLGEMPRAVAIVERRLAAEA